MQKFYEKHETLLCILLIAIYVVTNSLCLQFFESTNYICTIINSLLSIGLIILMLLLKSTSYYGLIKPNHSKRHLYFIPLLLIISVNLWNGINLYNTTSEIIFYILTMINIGFIEEIIFRGFLYKMLEKRNPKTAVLVSSLTFGIGHIVNLLNGASFLPTLMQICYAIAIGYLFVTIFQKSQSIIPCIITHALFNALSIFNIEKQTTFYLSSIFLILVPIIYAYYIKRQFKPKKEKSN